MLADTHSRLRLPAKGRCSNAGRATRMAQRVADVAPRSMVGRPRVQPLLG